MQDLNYDEMPLYVLELHPRSGYNSLMRAKIDTVGKLHRLLRQGRQEITNIRNFGEYSLEHILERLLSQDALPDGLPLDLDMRTLDKRINWILNTQLDDGSWFSNDEITTAALLCLVRHQLTNHTNIDFEKGLAWLKSHQEDIAEKTVEYAIARLIAEYEKSPIPECTFEVTEPNFMDPSFKRWTIENLRQIAILGWSDQKIKKYYRKYGIHGYLDFYSYVEIAWMAVGKPDSD